MRTRSVSILCLTLTARLATHQVVCVLQPHAVGVLIEGTASAGHIRAYLAEARDELLLLLGNASGDLLEGILAPQAPRRCEVFGQGSAERRELCEVQSISAHVHIDICTSH